MKKTYQIPSFEVMEIDYPQMLADSDRSANYGGNSEGVGKSSEESEVISPTAPGFVDMGSEPGTDY